MQTLVVLPTYEEAQTIDEVLLGIRGALPAAFILVVDDGSPDGTAERAESAAGELGRIDVLRRAAKAGLGSAYRAGFRWGLDRGFDAMVEMDSDLSHNPAALPALVEPLADSADLVIGSRYVPGGSIPNWSLWRVLLSRWGNRYAAAMLGLDVRDSTAGFRAYRAEVLEAVGIDSVRAEGYGFQIEMTYRVVRAGYRVVEVPITFVDRTLGNSKMSSHVITEALVLVTGWGLRDRLRRVHSRPK
ncbi:MAG TPA: polyprenol monophosphomannose synthase [Acidimicrobiales bacterium]|nr:polyprenol monophosphomannose synthase [Acidimicrobiales bacterium]